MSFQMRITEFSPEVQQVLINIFGFKESGIVNENNLYRYYYEVNAWDDDEDVDETSTNKLVYWELLDEHYIDLDKMSKQVTKGTFQDNVKKKANKIAIKKHAFDDLTGKLKVEYEIDNVWDNIVLVQRTFLKKVETDTEYETRQNKIKHEIFLDKALQEMKELEASLKS